MSRARVRLPSINLKGKGTMLAALVVLIASAVLYATFTTYVLPSEVAVRQVYLGPKKGIQQDVYGPGLHFVMPGYERLHRFERDIQLLEFNDNKVSGSKMAHVQPSIRIQTSEGYQVTVDVTISYRVVDPYRVITAVGPLVSGDVPDDHREPVIF